MVTLDEMLTAIDGAARENRLIAKLFLSTEVFKALTKCIPVRPAEPCEITGLALAGIPVFIDDVSGFGAIAFDSDGSPIWMAR